MIKIIVIFTFHSKITIRVGLLMLRLNALYFLVGRVELNDLDLYLTPVTSQSSFTNSMATMKTEERCVKYIEC